MKGQSWNSCLLTSALFFPPVFPTKASCNIHLTHKLKITVDVRKDTPCNCPILLEHDSTPVDQGVRTVLWGKKKKMKTYEATQKREKRGV